MSFTDYSAAIQRVCVADEPPAADLALLGDSRVWLVYRSMVRRRLRAEVGRVLKRTAAALGKPGFDALFDRVLCQHPPDTRFFYQVPLWFSRAAAPLVQADPAAPAFVVDLMRYEAAAWEVSDLSGEVSPPPGEFAFDRVAVLSPAMRMLVLRHDVQRAPGSEGYAEKPQHVLLHRASDEAPVRTWTISGVTFDLLQYMCDTPVPVTQALAAVAEKRGVAMDAGFVDKLCGVLADFIERGVILGSR